MWDTYVQFPPLPEGFQTLISYLPRKFPNHQDIDYSDSGALATFPVEVVPLSRKEFNIRWVKRNKNDHDSSPLFSALTRKGVGYTYHREHWIDQAWYRCWTLSRLQCFRAHAEFWPYRVCLHGSTILKHGNEGSSEAMSCHLVPESNILRVTAKGTLSSGSTSSFTGLACASRWTSGIRCTQLLYSLRALEECRHIP